MFDISVYGNDKTASKKNSSQHTFGTHSGVEAGVWHTYILPALGKTIRMENIFFMAGDYRCATESQPIGEVSLKKEITLFYRAG